MAENRIDRMSDRCIRTCGVPQESCFVNSRQQLNCIADMVINKTSVISMSLDFVLEEADRSAAEETIRDSIASAHELSNWIRYLQLIQDLRQLSSLVLDSDASERRREIRYPMPEDFRKLFGIRMTLPGESVVPAAIANFSQSGAQLVTPRAAQAGSTVKCAVSLGREERKEISFRAEVKYSVPAPRGEFVLGLRVIEVSGRKSFNFFNHVYSLMLETEISP